MVKDKPLISIIFDSTLFRPVHNLFTVFIRVSSKVVFIFNIQLTFISPVPNTVHREGTLWCIQSTKCRHTQAINTQWIRAQYLFATFKIKQTL